MLQVSSAENCFRPLYFSLITVYIKTRHVFSKINMQRLLNYHFRNLAIASLAYLSVWKYPQDKPTASEILDQITAVAFRFLNILLYCTDFVIPCMKNYFTNNKNNTKTCRFCWKVRNVRQLD